MEKALAARMGKKVDVILRDAAELRQVLKANPFPDAHPARVAVAFCSEPVQKKIFDAVVIPANEQIVVGHQEFYVHYPDGMGQSKLKFPKVVATVRNINTVTKLVTMADAAAPPPRPGRHADRASESQAWTAGGPLLARTTRVFDSISNARCRLSVKSANSTSIQ